MKQKAKKIKVLVVDDEIGIRELLSEILVDEGYAVATAHDAESAHKARIEHTPEIILLDIWMPDSDGISLLRRWKNASFPNIPVVVMSGHATIDMAVDAMRLGALEVLEKPIGIKQLMGAMDKAKTRKSKQESNLLLRDMEFGNTLAMKKFKSDLLHATADIGIVTLVGKLNGGAVFYAKYLARPQRPVALLESGQALEDNIGDIIRRAEDGIIVARLVNVYNIIQQNGFLGLVREAKKKKVRVVATIAEPPEVLAERGDFNETLHALLSRHVVEVPSLAKCRDDLPVIIEMICDKFTRDNPAMQNRKLSAGAMDLLAGAHYEDDFAELMSVIRTVFLSASGDKIEAAAVKACMRQQAMDAALPSRTMFEGMHTMSLREARERFEHEYFTHLINMTNGNMQQAAKIAGLERTYFYRKLKKYSAESIVENES